VKPALEADGRRERLLERLHDAVDHGNQELAQQLLDTLMEAPADAPAAYARWRCLSLSEDLEEARAAAEEAVAAFPDEAELHHALGWTLAEMGRPDEAVVSLQLACEIDPESSDGWHDLAVAWEMLGDLAGMRTAFKEVYALDTAEPREPHVFSTEQILSWADRAVRILPEEVCAAVKILPIFVQDYPDDWILEEPPYDPRLLGLFDGPTFAQWQGIDGPQGTPHVYLYQRNLERICPDPRLMAEQVRITVHHEIGHFLGLDELDLIKRGLG
jgi:predicted Zn-dependent protease with MMP-like domain